MKKVAYRMIKDFLKKISWEKVYTISCKLIGLCFLWLLIILLLTISIYGVKRLLPALIAFFSLVAFKQSKTIFECVLNNAHFTIVYISILFTLISILVAVLIAWGTRVLDKLEKYQAKYNENLKALAKIKEEAERNLAYDGPLTTSKIYYAIKNYSKAWEYIENIPNTFSYEVSLYKARILFYREKDKSILPRVFKLLETALQTPGITPGGEADVYGFIGQAWLRAENYKQALVYSKKAIERKYIYWSAHNQKAICLRHLEQLEKAIETLEDIISVDNNFSYAHYNLACYYCLKMSEDKSYRTKVLFHLKKAIELMPEHKEVAKSDPDFDNIRDDPEFQDLLK